MSTLLAHSFPIATIETYFLKKLCSVQCTVAMKKQKRMVKKFSIWSSTSSRIPQQNATITFHHTPQKTDL